jgi:4-hydroxy-3-polyprenylbenzoate decarboxylase
VKFILFVDDLVDIASFSQVVWISANNIDPVRDCFHTDVEPGVKFPALCIDATRKTRLFDDFLREWPNVIAMDDDTIHSVDKKWPGLDLGPLISSPSLAFKSLIVNDGAVFSENF